MLPPTSAMEQIIVEGARAQFAIPEAERARYCRRSVNCAHHLNAIRRRFLARAAHIGHVHKSAARRAAAIDDQHVRRRAVAAEECVEVQRAPGADIIAGDGQRSARRRWVWNSELHCARVLKAIAERLVKTVQVERPAIHHNGMRVCAEDIDAA